jgi:hypothetical protein
VRVETIGEARELTVGENVAPAPVERASIIAGGTVVSSPAESAVTADSNGKTVRPKSAEKSAPLPNPAAATRIEPAKKKAVSSNAAPAKKAIAKGSTSSTKKPDVATAKLKIIANLRDHPMNRPATRTALQRHVVTILGNGTTPEFVQARIDELERTAVITITPAGKVEYKIATPK